ncbi:hypothetical protein J3R30DRAFT_2595340 [Lentinula aciculospora]|uniref:Uncharacterized protein n=1 Tax=Lentinula aciculospora TaxID=153920 RepID=A0A9W9AEL7_9AGAR|nr:hypothetical protein J3R30DRAFT_2595340 [Lentinula aciculospora]
MPVFLTSRIFSALILLSTLFGVMCIRPTRISIKSTYRNQLLPAHKWELWIGYDLFTAVPDPQRPHMFKIAKTYVGKYSHSGKTIIGYAEFEIETVDENIVISSYPAQVWHVDCFNQILTDLVERKLMKKPTEWEVMYNGVLESGAIQLKRELNHEGNDTPEEIPYAEESVNPKEKWTLYIGNKHGLTAVLKDGQSIASKVVNKEFKGQILEDVIPGLNTAKYAKYWFDAIPGEVLKVPVKSYNLEWIHDILQHLEERKLIDRIPDHFKHLHKKMIDSHGDAAGNVVPIYFYGPN